MNFDFSDDQKMLKDQARKFLEDKCSYDDMRTVLGDDSHHDGVWNSLCELGIAGAAIPEEFGGLGLILELCVIAEELAALPHRCVFIFHLHVCRSAGGNRLG